MAQTLTARLLTVALVIKSATSNVNAILLRRFWLPAIAALIAATLVPANWWTLPPQGGQDGNHRRQLATVIVAQVRLPEYAELGTIPLAEWISPAGVRVTSDELRGFTKVDDETGTNAAWAVITDASKLAELVTPEGGCGAGTYLLGPIKFRRNDSKAAMPASQPIKNMRSLSGEVADSFCLLSEKSSSNEPPVVDPPKVVFSDSWRRPIAPPPIFVRAPEIKVEGDWPTIRMPDIVVHPPKITPTDAWSAPQTLPPVAVDPPKVTPTDAWSKAQPLPSFVLDPPIVEPTPEWKKAQRLPPVAVDPPNGRPSRGFTRLGAVYFKQACPQVAKGARCNDKNDVQVSAKERPEPIGLTALVAETANILNENSLALIFVVGSADPIGEDGYNADLSMLRASWLRDEILKHACGTDESCKTPKRRRVVTHAAGEMPTPPKIPVQPQHRRADVFVYTGGGD